MCSLDVLSALRRIPFKNIQKQQKARRFLRQEWRSWLGSKEFLKLHQTGQKALAYAVAKAIKARGHGAFGDIEALRDI